MINALGLFQFIQHIENTNCELFLSQKTSLNLNKVNDS